MESLSVMKFYLWTVLFCGTGLLLGFQGTAGQPPIGGGTIIRGGREFILQFIDSDIGNRVPLWRIIVDRPCPTSTSVSMSINNSDFKKNAEVKKGEPATFEFPNPQQITGSGTSSRSVIITANDDITVLTRNFKETSGDVALMYPRDHWGKKYYVITPMDDPSKNYAVFAVIASDTFITLTMVVSGSVQYNGKNYSKGDTITVDLEPLQFLKLQSKDDLSGTRVTSQHPVAIMSGHSCVPGIGDCSLVYEQLLPEETWGTSYFVAVPSFLPCESEVYVLASKFTHLTCQSGEEKLKTTLEAGKPMKFKVSASKPLSIHSTEKIQVFLYGCGRNFEGQTFGSFLTKIPDIESFSRTYNLIGQEDFDNNYGVIIAKASSVAGFIFNGKSLQNAEWNAFPDSEYVWSEMNYGKGSSSNTMQNLIKPFGLLNIGHSSNKVYGTVAAAIGDLICPILHSVGEDLGLERKRRRAENDP